MFCLNNHYFDYPSLLLHLKLNSVLDTNECKSEITTLHSSELNTTEYFYVSNKLCTCI